MMNKNTRIIKVLQVALGDGSYGGVASFLYTFYAHMDHSKIVCDFLYCAKNSLISKMNTDILNNSKITTLGAIKPTNNGIKEYRKLIPALRKYFKENNYDVVHINTSNVYLCASVLYAAPKTTICITHSHNTKSVLKNRKNLMRQFKNMMFLPCRKYVLNKSSYYFACSRAAGIHLYGKKILENEKFKVINNAIDVERFKFNIVTRRRIRNTDRFVFGHVGRMTEQKNHLFLLNIFKEIHRHNPNTELWLVGEGELKSNLEESISDMGLSDCIKLLGRRDDVADLMQAMDTFIFPSLYEGLSIGTIEAQAAGLPIFASDSISLEHRVTDLVTFISLKESAETWAERILADLSVYGARRDMSSQLINKGYEIKNAAKELQDFYVKAIK